MCKLVKANTLHGTMVIKLTNNMGIFYEKHYEIFEKF